MQLFSIGIIAEKAVLHLVTHHLHKKTVKNCCPIYKKAAEDTFTMGRVLDGIRLSGMLRSENVLLYSFLSASTIFSGGGTKIFRLIGFAIKGCYFATAPKSAFS